MASVSFFPIGSQLDNDLIQDLQVNVGDRFRVTFELDTSGLNANLQSIDIQVDQDLVELDLSAVRTDFDQTAFPNFSFSGSPQGDNLFSAVFERSGPPGAVPDRIEVIVEGELTALSDLENDGQPDLGITVVKAIDANGEDVINLFEPLNQAIDVQPFPVVSIGLEPTFIIEGGQAQTVTLNLSEPAPPGGLVVDALITDSDTETDTNPIFDQAQNLVDAEVVLENGQAIARFTIAEGATQASLDFAAFEDNQVEGYETFSLTVLPRDGYNLDPDNRSVTSAIIDLDNVIDGTPSDDLLNGTDEVDAIFGEGGNDAIFGNGGADALFGGEGKDLVVGSVNNDFLDGGNDFLDGGLDNDKLFGDDGEDFLFGDDGRDRLLGGGGADPLNGGNGEDTLVGGKESDLLNGGSGDDRLIGVDINSKELGRGENDILTGSSGADTFVLGIETGSFYDDGNSFSSGDADFARITDFNAEEDRIQLFDFADRYSLDFLANSAGNVDARLIYDPGIASGSELIALLENVSPDLRIEEPAFTFI